MRKFKLLLINLILISSAYAQFPKEAWVLDSYSALNLIEFFNDSIKAREIDNGLQARGGDIWTILDSCKGHYFSTDFNFITNHLYNDSIVVDSMAFDRCWSCYNSGGIVPIPKSDSLYFILSSYKVDTSLYYSIFNANADNGIGKLDSRKNKMYHLDTDLVRIIRHKNQKDYWIVARKVNGETPIWLLDSTGIPKLHRTYNFSPYFINGSRIAGLDQLYASSNGDKLIFSTSDSVFNLIIADFDNWKGEIDIVQNFNINPIFSSIDDDLKYLGARYIHFIDSTKILYLTDDNYDGIVQLKLNVNYLPVEVNYFIDTLYINELVTIPLRYNGFHVASSGQLFIKNYSGNFDVKDYDTILNNLTVLEDPWIFGDKSNLHPLSFGVDNKKLVGKVITRSTTQLGGSFNGVKTFDFNKVCLNDTLRLIPVNLDCTGDVVWNITYPNETKITYNYSSPELIVDQIGTYNIKMIQGIDTITKSLKVNSTKDIFSLIDSTLCQGDSLKLNFQEKELIGFSWKDDYNSLDRIIDFKDTLTLEKKYNCNSEFIEIRTNIISNEDFEIPSFICGIDSIYIPFPEDNNWNFELKNFKGNTVNKSDSYEIIAKNECYLKTYEIVAEIQPNPIDSDINVFTPNGDGINDFFNPINQNNNYELDEYKIDIYSKWGKKVFSSTDINVHWSGGDLPSSDYFYLLSYYACNGQKIKVKGNIKLMR
jgi:gliding motility-associated-like protein